jgi:hypothetical protein
MAMRPINFNDDTFYFQHGTEDEVLGTAAVEF